MTDLDLSILDRVKKRLLGPPVDDTQVIPDFETSILFTPTDETQRIGGAVRLPQLELDETEFVQSTQAQTQLIGRRETANRLSGEKGEEGYKGVYSRQDQRHDGGENNGSHNDTGDSGDIISDITTGTGHTPGHAPGPAPGHNSGDAPAPLDTESRAARLAALVDQKRQERLRAVEAEEAQFRDGPAVDSSTQGLAPAKTRKELEHLDKILHTQKRGRPIAPAFTRRVANPLLKLVAAFDSDSESPNAAPAASAAPSVAAPGASPASAASRAPASNAAPAATSHADSLDDELNVLDLISRPSQPVPQPKRNPIDEYAQRLYQHKDAGVVLDDSDTDAAPEVPQMTKEQILAVKKKYSRRPEQLRGALRFHPPRARAPDARLVDQLRRANTRQLQQRRTENPDEALLEEIDQEEEEMSTLLEREMERVRRIRRRERAEAAAAEEAANDAEYAPGAESDVSVPDSEEGSDDDGGDSDSEGGDSAGADDDMDGETRDKHNAVRERRRARRVVESDDEGQSQASDAHDKEAVDAKEGDARHDDSYMFGGGAERDDDAEEMPIQSDARALLPIDVASLVPTERHRFRLFDNLGPRTDIAPETSIDESIMAAPSFTDLPESQIQPTQPMQLTQITQLTQTTQADATRVDLVQFGAVSLTQADDADESDDDFPAAVHKGRLQVKAEAQAARSAADVQLAGGAEAATSEAAADAAKSQLIADELAAEQLAAFEARIRRKELRARRRRKELERRGIGAVVEGEAEESEDEWKGIGGADVDESDQADSEDERMIDNNFNLDLNDEEVRRKFMEQYRVKDHKELEKLMDDIKNHRLTKRARAGKFDIELSDEEDELLMAYRRQKLQEQKLRLLANQKLQRLSKNDRASAFFESIHEEPVSIKLDDSDAESDGGNATNERDDDATGDDVGNGESDDRPRRLVLEESFVQKQLSFLSKTAEDEYSHIQNQSLLQHAEDDIEDLAVLKSRSLSNLYSRALPESQDNKRSHEEVQTDDDENVDDSGQNGVDNDDNDGDDSDEESFPLFKKPSVVSSFRSFHEKRGVQVSNKAFSGVTVSKQYKVASGSKASISYLSKTSKTASKAVRSLKVRKIEETIDRSRSEGSFFGSGAGFS